MKTSFLTILFILPFTFFGQSFWSKINNETAVLQLNKCRTAVSQDSTFSLDLPLPDGGNVFFDFKKASVFPENLQTKYPNIKAFEGVCTLDKTTKATLTMYQDSLYAMIRFKDKIVTIKPISGNLYEVKWNAQVTLKKHDCTSKGVLDPIDLSNTRLSTVNSISQIKNYRIAISTTGEYAQFHGGTVESTLAAIVVSLNRVNTIFKVELGINLILSNETDQLIYTDPNTDPFNNSNANSMLNVYSDLLYVTLGKDAYDLGHVFSTNGGGLADLSCVCQTYFASGVTGITNPIGDVFDVSFVAHELGHQFGATHTFNGIHGDCESNISNTSYEPGSGTTIMSYAGICDEDNIQEESDPYFHIKSIEQIRNYIEYGDGNTCGFYDGEENYTPEIIEHTENLVIPISTPFILNGEAIDSDSDELTYNWEQTDIGLAQSLGSASGNSPLFRSQVPTGNTNRFFPVFQDVLNNQSYEDEILPSYERNMSFSFNVRDQEGGVTSSNVFLEVDENAGPFMLQFPDSNEVFLVNETIEVLWDVANTNNENVNCQTVSIILALDGENFTDTLLLETPNDGMEFVVLPSKVSDKCRVMVIARDNIFYDISNYAFEINSPETPFFYPNISFSKEALCHENDQLNLHISADSFTGFNDSISYQIQLNSSDVVSIEKNVGMFNFDQEIEAILTSKVITENQYVELTIAFQSDSIEHIIKDSILVYASVQAPTLLVPLDNAINVGLSSIFDWEEKVVLLDYQLIIWDEDSNHFFESEIISESEFSISGLDKKAIFNWVVVAVSDCGVDTSDVFELETGVDTCFTTYSENLPLKLLNGKGVFYDTIQIDSYGDITEVSIIDFSGTHEWVSDLEVTLFHPNKTSFTLFSNTCFDDSGENFDLNFVNDPNLSIAPCPPIGGDFKPLSSFDPIIGESSFGDWVLSIQDFHPSFDSGELVSWGIEICVDEKGFLAPIKKEQEQSNSVYPNPSFGMLYVEGYEGKLEIYTVLGEFVLSVEKANEINVSTLQTGIYFLKQDNGIIHKFSKQ